MNTSVDSFSFGKGGRRVSESERLVKQLNTWHVKTLDAKLREHGINPSHLKTRQSKIVELATAMLKPKKAPL